MICSVAPLPMDMSVMTAVTPITIPSSASPARSLLAARDEIAVLMVWSGDISGVNLGAWSDVFSFGRGSGTNTGS